MQWIHKNYLIPKSCQSLNIPVRFQTPLGTYKTIYRQHLSTVLQLHLLQSFRQVLSLKNSTNFLRITRPSKRGNKNTLDLESTCYKTDQKLVTEHHRFSSTADNFKQFNDSSVTYTLYWIKIFLFHRPWMAGLSWFTTVTHDQKHLLNNNGQLDTEMIHV